ncbi:hypothetical protein OFN49_34455, partial [Escherichia coli]|nr:hypothetical protein [Escherichia coli]
IQGIVGYKGRVHVAFGDVIEQEFETPESLAGEIDRQIHNNYKLYPINLLAAGHEDSSIITEAVKRHLADKLDQLPEGARPYLVASY